MKTGTRIPADLEQKIYEMCQDGEHSQRDIARKFGVSWTLVSKVLSRYPKEHPAEVLKKNGVLDIDSMQDEKSQRLTRLDSLESRLDDIESRIQSICGELGIRDMEHE